MKSSVSKLRRKYIITASAIVFAVILLMIAVLNLLMQFTYKNEKTIVEGVISQAAVSNINKPYTEKFILSDAAVTDNGDYIIPRDVRDISGITVYGNIVNNGKAAIWYSAGGGLMFEAKIHGNQEMVYKDYTFNKDTTNISIDFSDYDNLKWGYLPISVDEEQITGSYFLVSTVWWKNSSTIPDDMDNSIELTLDSIEIHYKDMRTIPEYTESLVSHISFSDIFKDEIPEAVNVTGAFYLISDEEGNLISINNGNLANPIENEEAEKYLLTIGKNNSGRIEKDGYVYSCTVHHTDGLNILVFLNENFTANANRNLFIISVLVAAGVWIILFVIIFIVSGYVVKPVEETMERQKQFISNASHELKTPVTVISAAIDIISSKKGADKWTDCIKQQSKKMQRLVTELLDLSRMLEENTDKNSFAPCSLSTVVTNSLLYFESIFFEKNKTLKQDIEDGITMNCDESKISQLVGILVDNALKYSDDCSTIEFTLKTEKDNAVIKCSNPCSNFSPEDTARLFERFYRSSNDCTQEQEGFGLGLSIAQAVAKLHKGKIFADYKDGVITFTVILPVK
ncbi:MAG: sensor histidine kinase [Ruminococcus sp.]